MKNLILVIAILLLAACGSKFEGVYSDSTGQSQYVFNADKTGTIVSFIGNADVKWERNGKAVKMIGPNGSIDLTWEDDGTVTRNGLIYRKVQK